MHHRTRTAPADDPGGRAVERWIERSWRTRRRSFTLPPTSDFAFEAASAQRREQGEAGTLTFPSALTTPHPENNVVTAAGFLRPATSASTRAANRGRAVVVLPQWNSDAGGHIGLSRVLARFGVSALRLSLPYHDVRMPPELTRADYIVSSNIVRTVQVCRQAVLDARRAVAWLASLGFERIGIVGTSLGSCLAMLTSAHEPLIRAQALNHVSPWFADVVWRGLSTQHVRHGLDGHIDLERLRRSVAADQPLVVSGSRRQDADAAGLRRLRPDVSASTCRSCWSTSSDGAGCRTKRRSCAAVTTAPDRSRSSSSMDTC